MLPDPSTDASTGSGLTGLPRDWRGSDNVLKRCLLTIRDLSWFDERNYLGTSIVQSAMDFWYSCDPPEMPMITAVYDCDSGRREGSKANNNQP